MVCEDYSEDQEICLRMLRMQATECTALIHVPVTQKGSMIWQQGVSLL